MAVAFASSILGSIYRAVYPEALSESNSRLLFAILHEAIALCLFLVLFKRQGLSPALASSFGGRTCPKALDWL